MANEFQIKHGLIVSGSVEIEQDLRVKGILTVDELHTSITTSSIIYESGSTRFGDSSDDTHDFTGSVSITGSISLNGEPLGTGKLDETTFQSYTSSNDERVSTLETSSGSLNTFTSSINTTIKSKLDNDGVISGSIQINITEATGYSTFSSSIATTDLNQNNRLTSVEDKTGSYATTGSNLFIGTQTHSGSILPSVDNTYDLGSVTHQWRDVYISSGSLYIDGTKVLSSTAQELVITTDNGQSIKILEGTTDSIILQTADGNIELKSSADGDILLDPTNGKILLKGPVEILSGQKIQSSVGGTPVVFANDVVISGSIDITGTIEGIDLTAFSSSVNTRLGGLESSAVSLNSYTSSNTTNINAIHTATSSLNSFTSSASGRLTSLETASGSVNTFTASAGEKLTSLESESSSIRSDFNTFTSSALTSVSEIEIATSSLNTFTSSINTTIKSKLDNDGVISGSIQVDITGTTGYSTFSSSIASTTLEQSNRITVLDLKTGSYATTGSNIFQGNQTITGSLYVSQDLIIAGSSSIQHISSSVVNIADNIITVNAQNPSVRFGGLAVVDSGSFPQVSGSMLFDSTNDQWVFAHQNQLNITSSILLMGPQTFNNLGNETYPTTNRILKSVNAEHVGDSNITDSGTDVSINSNTIITGSLLVTNTIVSQTTPLVSGSSQISFNGITDKPTLVSGSSQVLNGSGIWSGSAQLPSGIVSGSSQVLNGTGIWSGSAQLPSGVVSGSAQVLLGTTIHSGSFFNNISVVSGSSQISFNGITDKPALVSGSSQISFSGIADKPTLVSGSSQITYGSLSGIPGGIVSGSAQVDLTSTTNYSTGIKTRLNAEGVISGSSQVTSIANSQLTNSSFHVGTTSISLGRTSAAQTLAGVSIDGNSGTATTLQTSRTIGGVSFNGSANIDLPGVNTAGNQNTSGTAASAPTLTASGGLTTQAGSGTLTHSYALTAGTTGLFSTGDNSNSIITFNRHPGDYYSQLGFNSSGNIYYRSFNNAAINTSQGWQTIWTSSSLTNLNQLTNGPGYITSYTETSTLANVTSRGSSTTTLVTLSKTNSTLYNANAYNGGTGQLSITSTINSTGVYNGIRFAGGSGSHEGFFGTVQNSSGLAEFIFQTYNGSAYGERTRITSKGSFLHGHAIAPSEDAWLGTAVFGKDSYNKVIIGSLNSTTTGAYIGGHNSALTAWADINVSGENIIFRYQQTERARFDTSGHFVPGANNSYNLGSASLGWANVYTNDLHLSNMNKPEGNDIDGTNGTWTIQEGEENLYIINNRNNKKFKISLEEIL